MLTLYFPSDPVCYFCILCYQTPFDIGPECGFLDVRWRRDMKALRYVYLVIRLDIRMGR
jgi:hypothetical protein